MKPKFLRLLSAALLAAASLAGCSTTPLGTSGLEQVRVSDDRTGFVLSPSGRPFRPWGVNYGNAGRLMEDFWEREWATIEGDFREIAALGGNVVRVHLQFGKFMDGPNTPNRRSLDLLARMLALGRRTGIYLDVTGLASYRPADRPAWYDALDEEARWQAQAVFWKAVAKTCARNPALFCYDLMNEPISPAGDSGKWYSGNLLGEYDFVQFIARTNGGRTRGAIATSWIDTMTQAIRAEDPHGLITVGGLPWVTGWKHLSGFVPAEIAAHLDFISVHIYPKSKDPAEAARALSESAVGKPVVIEETFPLECSVAELEAFLRSSRDIACGWVWHYDGITLEEYDALEQQKKLTMPQAIWRAALQSFVRLGPEFKATP